MIAIVINPFIKLYFWGFTTMGRFYLANIVVSLVYSVIELIFPIGN